eukprot:CAMPEP_0182857518 /NCGR_PEP_ID=MMETSP0034_2-20130328/3095_1 /TAXON_ID=156128 /ORGANISM="Nephroselmis pyriformis, Strain CCMP717" /LENGTH=243 /DNA_ID=CAMNT_0024988759 /DNA_START=103 /DNA_END=831 /DNA_ORIENTATION=-
MADAAAMPARLGEVLIPGDTAFALPPTGQIRIGGGLQQVGESVAATRAGRLSHTQVAVGRPGAPKVDKFWVQGTQKRYIPAVEDMVIGTVLNKHAENIEVDIGAPFQAQLPALAFEGATKRNRPNLQVGQAVLGRVTAAHKDLEPAIACVDAHGKSSGFGPLEGGYVFECTTGLARSLLARPPCTVLTALNKKIAFELAVGQNGRVWVNTGSPAETILVSNAILNAEFLTPAQTERMVGKLLE